MTVATMNSPELRAQCATELQAVAQRPADLKAFLGLDGFVDAILHVVDKRINAAQFDRVPTIAALAQRLGAAAGRSANVELVTQFTKLGGNGPIMANALASFGIGVTYVGALGYPNLHPVFNSFAGRAKVHSIAEPGLTDAFEFDDGKIMFGKHTPLAEITWPNIQARLGPGKFSDGLADANFVGFVNWTMLPYMSDVWESLLNEVCPALNGQRRTMFFDLADPAKRLPEDLRRALDLIVRFEKHFDVILGLNESEACAVAGVLDIPVPGHSPEQIQALTQTLSARLPVNTVVVHPVAFAAAASRGGPASLVGGPLSARPKITTGAGDHFNAGFCLGRLLGLDHSKSLLTGVATSGYYVRTAESPSVPQLVGMLQNWPQE